MIKIICVGKIKEKYLSDLINDYKLRISKYQKVEIIELKDSTKEKENEEILKHINEKDFNICMDIKGKKINSEELSNLIDRTFTQGYSTTTFIIGASDGLTDEVKNKCNYKLSFSDMTFPHQLMRVVLLEQIYRAETIINNVTFIEERSPETVLEYNLKLKNRIADLIADANVDEQRLLTEAAIFADKIAVAEETVRLRSHIEQLHSFFESDEPIGRKLDFLVQEINREANTIGSKASDIEIARRVIEIKSEIEKIREQIQNIE